MFTRKIIMLSLFALMFFPFKALCLDPVPIYPENYKVLMENDRVRVLDFQLKKVAKEDAHSHPAHVVYVITGFKIRFTLPDGSTRIRETKDGDVWFSEAITHASENIGDTDAHGILVELKSPQPGESGQITPSDEQITAVTFIHGIKGKDNQLKKELLSLEAPTRAEPGNIAYDLYQSTDKENQFMRLEVWRSAQALEEHKKTPHIKASFDKRKQQGWTTEITTWKAVSVGR